MANRLFLSQLPPEFVGDILDDEDIVSLVAKQGDTGEGMDMST